MRCRPGSWTKRAQLGQRLQLCCFATWGDNAPSANHAWEPRNITWTHYYGKEETFSRIDFILISQGMAREWVKEDTYIPFIPNWGVASDHRPIVATFEAADR